MDARIVKIAFPIVTVAVLATAVFGFSVMSEPGHMMAVCFGSAPGAACPMLSLIEHFAAHVRAFAGISTAIPQISFLLAVLFLLTFATLPPTAKQIGDPPVGFVVRHRDGFVPPQRVQLARWISLHEKRDPSPARAVSN